MHRLTISTVCGAPAYRDASLGTHLGSNFDLAVPSTPGILPPPRPVAPDDTYCCATLLNYAYACFNPRFHHPAAFHHPPRPPWRRGGKFNRRIALALLPLTRRPPNFACTPALGVPLCSRPRQGAQLKDLYTASKKEAKNRQSRRFGHRTERPSRARSPRATPTSYPISLWGDRPRDPWSASRRKNPSNSQFNCRATARRPHRCRTQKRVILRRQALRRSHNATAISQWLLLLHVTCQAPRQMIPTPRLRLRCPRRAPPRPLR